MVDFKNMSEEQFEQFCPRQLQEYLGIEILDVETKVSIFEQIGELSMREFMLDLYDATPIKHQEELKAMIESDDFEFFDDPIFIKFLETHISDPMSMFAKAQKKVYDSYHNGRSRV